jgi:hypothetical protein
MFTKSFPAFRAAPSASSLRAVVSDVAAAIGMASPGTFTGRPLLLTATLFLGPLAMTGLDRCDYYLRLRRHLIRTASGIWGTIQVDYTALTLAFAPAWWPMSLMTLRNLVVAPISEEVVSIKRDLISLQKRPNITLKETY